MQGLINTAIRGAALGIKFIFILYLSKALNLSEYGIYGLITSTVAIMMYILGIDFYNYSNRELINTHEGIFEKLFSQTVLHLIIYFLVVPFLFILGYAGTIPFDYIPLLIGIVVLEHFNQEISRILVAFNYTISSSIQVFGRNAIWIIFIFLLGIKLDLFSVLRFWLWAELVSLFYGLAVLTYFFRTNNIKINFTVDKSWIFKGLDVIKPFIIATVALKVIEFSDRYLIDFFLGKEKVGVYSLYSSVANVLNVGMYSMVFMLYYPKLVESADGKAIDKTLVSNFKKETKIYVGLFFCALSIGIFAVLYFINKDQFNKYISSYFILLLGNLFLNISYIYHYILYSFNDDNTLKRAAIYGSLVNILINIIMIEYLGILGASLGTLAAYLVILIVKFRRVDHFYEV